MAQYVESQYRAPFAFMPDHNLQGRSRAQTPPVSAARSRILQARSESPASIHPAETTSPEKKLASKLSSENVADNVKVEEMTEVEFSYVDREDVVLPGEYEEYDDRYMDEMNESGMSDSDGDDGSDTAFAHRLSQLQCEDPVGEAQMRASRRQRRYSKRHGSRTFKRSHSQSIKSDTTDTDTDAMADHDLMSSARRLRRKVSKPQESILERPISHDPDFEPSSPITSPEFSSRQDASAMSPQSPSIRRRQDRRIRHDSRVVDSMELSD